MKKMILNNKLILGMALLVFGAVSCSDEDTEVVSLAKDVATEEAELDAALEDVDDFSSISLEVSQENAGGKIEDEIDDDRICDGIITFEGTKADGTLTIDFGEGCVDANGNIRTGKVIITYSGRYFEPGSVTTITLEDYSINGMEVEGTRTVTNITTDGSPTWNITLVGGKVTFEDGSVATREVERIRVWERAPSPINDRILITGVASGQTKGGVAYTSRITEELVYIRNCRRGRRGRVPVSGVNVITTENRTLTIDFGDGTCDRRFTVTSDDTEQEVTF